MSGVIATNRKAHFNYEILESFEAGVMLSGTEVKTIRAGKLNLNESYGILQGGELFLFNANIPVYSHGNIFNHDPVRSRKLLVHRHELRRLIGVTREKGLTLIPLKAYWKNGKVKIEVGIGRGKKLHDKRDTIRERDWQMEKQRLMKDSRDSD
ncbi:MAG: SsrA-binding protein SmpB [Magnetococcales bacterium]|nr:SsrA-binding protein SmpB [Magnetococcales bacterium]